MEDVQFCGREPTNPSSTSRYSAASQSWLTDQLISQLLFSSAIIYQIFTSNFAVELFGLSIHYKWFWSIWLSSTNRFIIVPVSSGLIWLFGFPLQQILFFISGSMVLLMFEVRTIQKWER
jgi:hypothetical protein